MSERPKTAERIEDEIQATQRRIDREIEAIQAQFQPAAILGRLVGADTDNGHGESNALFGPASLRAALIGAGISWLVQNGIAAGPDLRKNARGAAKKARKKAQDATEAGAETGEAALEAISDAAEQIRESGLRGLEWVKNNPIPGSLAGFAAGAAIAAVLSAALEETGGGAARPGKPAPKKPTGNGRTRKTAARGRKAAARSKPAARSARKTAARTSRAAKTASAAGRKPAARRDRRHAT